ncbi:MAG: hypothetical protein HYV93_10110 [Candidatus Rokubacteria bacterium]|nr:hypothetical protein [Candidatus Rokubacteria bacterium]
MKIKTIKTKVLFLNTAPDDRAPSGSGPAVATHHSRCHRKPHDGAIPPGISA